MTNPRQHGSQGSVLAALAAIMLAATNIMAPAVYDAGSNPQTVLMLRAATTVISIGVLLFLTRRLALLSAKNELFCVVSGVLFMFAGFGLLTALGLGKVSTVILVFYLYPILTTLLDATARREMPKPAMLFLLLIALFGLALALDIQGNEINWTAVGLALLAAVSAASTMVWNNHKLASIDPEQITMRMFVISFLVFGCWVVATDSFQIPDERDSMLLLALLMAFFAVAFITMFRAVQMAGSVQASMIMNLEPIVTILLSVYILSETLNMQQFVGAALVLIAVFASQSLGKKKLKS